MGVLVKSSITEVLPQELLKAYSLYRKECCPDPSDFRFRPRNENVTSLVGSYPIIFPDIREVLLLSLRPSEDAWCPLYGDILISLTSEELLHNSIDPFKYQTILAQIKSMFPSLKIKRSPKFSNLLSSSLIADEEIRSQQLATFNARAGFKTEGLSLRITAEPVDLVTSSVDAEYTSCLNWKLHDEYGTDNHNSTHSVWANLEDPTLAIAYLYLDGKRVARSNVRVVSFENVNYIYFSKVYAISYYGAVLKASLQHLSFENCRTVFLFNYLDYDVREIVRVPATFTLTSHGVFRCRSCEGTGYYDVVCADCDGETSYECFPCEAEGRIVCPSCVDGLVSRPCDAKHQEGLPCSLCLDSGVVVDVCGHCDSVGALPCYDCDASGSVPCWVCASSGETEEECFQCAHGFVEDESYGDVVRPYVDHSQITFESDSVIFKIPT